MSDAPRETVAVCIPTYKQAPFLQLALQSVLDQDYPVSEIWVADDASPDNTAEICAEFAEKYPQFHAHRHPQNLGIAGNTDFVLRQARATYVVRLDSDDRLLPGYVGKLVAALQSQPRAGYAHANVWEIDQHGNRRRLRSLHQPGGFEAPRDAVARSIRGYRVAANILMFRRSVLQKVGYTRGRGNFAEDYHLAVAIARAGHGNMFVPEPLSEYRVWSDTQGVRGVFEEQIQPGYAELGLDPAPIRRARRRSALAHVSALDVPGYTAEEKAGLETHLIGLGDSPLLRVLIQLNHWNLGFLWRAYGSAMDSTKRLAKAVLRPS